MSKPKPRITTLALSTLLLASSMGLAIPGAVAPGGLSTDFMQCANKDAGTPVGECHWIGSILQKTNSRYLEDDSVPQRLIFTGLDAGTHSLVFQHQSSKSSKHAYDFLTSFQQALGARLTSLNVCGDEFTHATAAQCSSLLSGAHATVAAPDALGTHCTRSVDAQIAAYETAKGDRAIDLYANAPITSATLTFNGHTTACNGYGEYTLTWESSATEVMVLFAGHLAVGQGGYGAGLGSSSISGGPYHFRLMGLTSNGQSTSRGAVDNQIQGAQGTTPQPNGATLRVSKVVDNTGLPFETAPSDFTMLVYAGACGGTLYTSFPGNADGVDVNVPAGDYCVTENPNGAFSQAWSGDCASGGAVTLASGETKSCTVTNTRVSAPPRLLVHKTVENDNGGLVTDVSAFEITVCGDTAILAVTPEADYEPGAQCVTFPASSSTSVEFASSESGPSGPVAFTVTESAYAGYLPSGTCALDSGPGASGCDAPASSGTVCSGTLTNDQVVSCSVVNEDQPVKLVVSKALTLDNGGTLAASDAELCVTATFSDGVTETRCAAGSETGTTYWLNAGAYSVDEPNVPAGYTATESGDCAGTAAVGDADLACTVTNDDQPVKLVVTKAVVNDNGGALLASEAEVCVTATFSDGLTEARCAAGSETGTTYWLNGGAYEVAETTVPAGYEATPTGDCGGTAVVGGGDLACAITNDDQPVKLVVTKAVVNDNGGDLAASGAELCVTATFSDGVTEMRCAAGSQTGTTYWLNAGAYAVDEPTVPAGYQATPTGDCDGAAAIGDADLACTVTNDDQPVKLVVTKTVVNDNGGALLASEAEVCVTATFSDGVTETRCAPGDAAGTTYWLNPGPYSVSEPVVPTGYVVSDSGDCAGAAAIGDADLACTVTNDDQPGTLTVRKTVINDNEGVSRGTKTAGDFTLCVTATFAEADGASPAHVPGTTRCAAGSETGKSYLIDAAPFSVWEVAHAGYAVSYTDCSGTMTLGGVATCEVVNDDKYVTRTQGFWSTKYEFTRKIFNTGVPGAGVAPAKDLQVGAKLVDTDSKLFGGWYAGISKTSSGKTDRAAVDQARMQLAQQLLAAKMNCAAFGCDQDTRDLLAAADAASVSGVTADILSYVPLVTAYNEGGHALPVPAALGPEGKSEPSKAFNVAKSGGGLAFWDAP